MPGPLHPSAEAAERRAADVSRTKRTRGIPSWSAWGGHRGVPASTSSNGCSPTGRRSVQRLTGSGRRAAATSAAGPQDLSLAEALTASRERDVHRGHHSRGPASGRRGRCEFDGEAGPRVAFAGAAEAGRRRHDPGAALPDSGADRHRSRRCCWTILPPSWIATRLARFVEQVAELALPARRDGACTGTRACSDSPDRVFHVEQGGVRPV